MGLRGPKPRVAAAAIPSAPLLAPSWLPATASAIWADVEPRLRVSGLLRPEHSELLAAWCQTAAELRMLAVGIDRDGITAIGPQGNCQSAAHATAARLRALLLVLGKAVGLDPSSASRLAGATPSAPPVNDVEAFMAKRRERQTSPAARAANRSVVKLLEAASERAGPHPQG